MVQVMCDIFIIKNQLNQALRGWLCIWNWREKCES